MELGELEILLLQTLREVGETSPGKIFSEMKKKKDVAYTSVTTTLYRLVDKGLIKKRSESKKRIYYSIDEKGQKYNDLVEKMTTGIINAFGSQAISHLVENIESLSPEETEELRKAIDNLKRKE